MHIRLIFATPDPKARQLLDATLHSACDLVCFELSAVEVTTRQEMMARLATGQDDVTFIDWALAGSGTPDLVREVLRLHPQQRVVVLLPQHYRQYRKLVWDAGACNGIPMEHVDQEWLTSVLCVMHRAMEREARLIAQYT